MTASDAGIAIRSFNDVSEAIGACLGKGGLLLIEDDLSQTFFDLNSGLAGELFQKLVNYTVRNGDRFAKSGGFLRTIRRACI